MEIKDLLREIASGSAPEEPQSFELVCRLMANAEDPLSDAQIGAYLFSTAVRKIAAGELVGAVNALRKHMVKLSLGLAPEVPIVDTCGTGGSGLDTFNTSTAAAFVCAGAGVVVAKHGNRAASSRCGSADLLEELGYRLDLSVEELKNCATKSGICFMFAPLHHPATKRVAAIRRELGLRTIFNFMGPLSNPAGAQYQVLGVSDRKMVSVMAEALLKLGCKRALIVRGRDGLDELSICAETEVCELNHGALSSYLVTPEEMELQRVDFEHCSGLGVVDSAKKLRQILKGEKGAYRDLVLLNAGAALYVCNKSSNMLEGIALARESIDSGAGLRALNASLKICRNR